MNISLFTYIQPFDTLISVFLIFFLFSISKFFFHSNRFNLTFFEIFNLLIIFLSLILFVLINFQINYILLRPFISIILIIASIFFIKNYSTNIFPKIKKEYLIFF